MCVVILNGHSKRHVYSQPGRCSLVHNARTLQADSILSYIQRCSGERSPPVSALINYWSLVSSDSREHGVIHQEKTSWTEPGSVGIYSRTNSDFYNDNTKNGMVFRPTWLFLFLCYDEKEQSVRLKSCFILKVLWECFPPPPPRKTRKTLHFFLQN